MLKIDKEINKKINFHASILLCPKIKGHLY